MQPLWGMLAILAPNVDVFQTCNTYRAPTCNPVTNKVCSDILVEQAAKWDENQTHAFLCKNFVLGFLRFYKLWAIANPCARHDTQHRDALRKCVWMTRVFICISMHMDCASNHKPGTWNLSHTSAFLKHRQCLCTSCNAYVLVGAISKSILGLFLS